MKEKARIYLESYGIRPSLQRMAVMEYLMSHKTHPAADEIFSALAPSIPTLSKTTVYNTLGTLAARGAILSLEIEPGQTRYDGDTSPHAHFYCTGCGRVTDVLPDPERFGAFVRENAPRGADVRGVQLSYTGVCAECHKTN